MANPDDTWLTELRQYLRYEPETGHFWWVKRTTNAARLDRPAGTPSTYGYIQIKFRGRLVFAHRLAFRLVHGRWPEDKVDHKDTVKTNNRIRNLREATHSMNMQNRHRALSTNKSGLLGASPKGSRWVATIRMPNGETLHLGCFATPEEAHTVYIEAKRRLHPGCTI